MNLRMLTASLLLLSATVAAAPTISDPVHCVQMPQAADLKQLSKTVLGSRDVGNVTVMQFSGDYGRANTAARAQVARSFYSAHPDRYDALIVFTTFEFETAGAQAFYNPVRNDVSGIGLDAFDFSAEFGSAGKLAGVVDMAALSRHRLNPRDPQYGQTLSILVHELMHRWTVKVRYRTSEGALSGDLLGESGVHWNYFLDSDASLMYGNDWSESPAGTFQSVKIRHRLNPLDLYLGGFASAVEVPPQRLIRGGVGNATDLPQLGALTGGTLEQIVIDQIIAAEGPRTPTAADAPRSFEAAIIVLTRPDEALSPEHLLQLEQLRIQAQSYFQAATWGRASLRVHTRQSATTAAAAPDYPVQLHPGAGGGASAAALLGWLKEAQHADGHFADLPATALRDTAMAYRALSFWAPQAVETLLARQWLLAEAPTTRDGQSWQAYGLGAMAPAPLWASSQASDGGYGLLDGWKTSPLDTALAARALRGAGQAERARRALLLLGGQQSADGGFAFLEQGSAQPSAVALIADELAQSDLPDAAQKVQLSRSWLESRQRADGGFGVPESTLHDSAAVLSAAARLGLSSTRRGQLQTYLLSRVGATAQAGGPRSSVYLMALSLQGLALEQGDNLSIEGALVVTPAVPVDGQLAVVSALIRNTGASDIAASVARLYDGDPAGSGIQIGADIVVPAITAGQSQRIEMPWNTRDQAGPHMLWLRIDALGQIAESREDDNLASTAVTVQPAPDRPELALLRAQVSLTPQVLSTVPSTVRVSGQLHNLGSVAISGATLQLDALSSTGLRQLARQAFDVPARGSVPFELSFDQSQASAVDLRLRADPDNAVSELDESNNQVDLRLEFGSATDLQITEADVQVQPTALAQGEDAQIRVRVHNRGTTDASDAVLLVEAVQGSNREPVTRMPLTISAGAYLERSVVWRPTATGAVTLDVQIDPDNAIAETEEANNRVQRVVEVSVATGINLVADAATLVITPQPVLEGQPLRLALTVRNLGVDAAGAFSVALYDNDPRSGGRQLAVTELTGLAARASAAVELLCPDLPLRGEHTLHVLVDALEQVSERNENDNIVPKAIDALGLPDLSLSSGAIVLEPAQPVSGQPLTARVRIDNLGEQAAEQVQLQLFTGLAGSGTLVQPQRELARIEAGASAELSWTFTYQGEAGDGLVSAVVDPANRVRETHENNNTTSLSFDSQSGAAFASPLYFSPNGDGVQDSTTVVFRDAASSTHQLLIRDGAERIVRRVANANTGALLTFVWDGREDSGRLAPDGEYSITAEQGSTRLGPLRVVLDTNRSSVLAAIGTPYEWRVEMPFHALIPEGAVSSPDQLFGVGGNEQLSGISVAAIKQFDVIAGGTPSDRVRADFWVAHGLAEGLTTVQPYQIAYASNGRELLIAVDEAGPSTEARMALWSLSLLDQSPPRRLAQWLPGSRILGELADERVLLGIPEGHEYGVYDLRRQLLSAFRSFDPDGRSTSRVFPHGIVRSGMYSGLAPISFVSDDATRAAFEMPSDEGAFYGDFPSLTGQPRSKTGFNSAGSHRLLRRRDGDEGVVDLIDLQLGETRTIYHGAIVQKPLPPPYLGSMETAHSIDAMWLSADEFVIIDSADRTVARFNKLGQQLSNHELGSLRRQGPYDPRGVNNVKVAATYPAADGWINGALEPNTGIFHLLMGEQAYFCFNTNGSCYPSIVTGNGHGFGLSEHFEVRASAEPTRTAGYGALPFPDTGDQIRFPAVYSSVYSLPVAIDEPRKYLESGNIELFGNQFQSRFKISAENRIAAPSYIVGDIWGMESHARTYPYSNQQDQRILSSLANLAVTVRAKSLGRSIRLHGTVNDSALKSWELSYQREGETGWSSISGVQTVPVVDQILLDWMPPSAGAWRIRLEALDLAGNRREAFAFADAAGAPAAIVDARISDRWLSPNGDGSHETVRVNFRVDSATSTQIQVRSLASGQIRRSQALSFGAGDLGNTLFEFDGRDDSGTVLADGQYRLELEGFSFPLTIDTQAPDGRFTWRVELPLYEEDVLPPRCIASTSPALKSVADADHLALSMLGSRSVGGDQWVERPTRLGCAVAVAVTEAVSQQWRLRLADHAGNQRNLSLPAVSPLLALNGLVKPGSHIVLPDQLPSALFVDVTTGLTQLRVETSTRTAPNQWRLLTEQSGARSDLNSEQMGSVQWLGHGIAVPLDLRGEAVGSWVNVRGIGQTLAGQQLISDVEQLHIGAFPQPSLDSARLERCDAIVKGLVLPKPWRNIELVMEPADGGTVARLVGAPNAEGTGLLFKSAVSIGKWKLAVSLVDGDGVQRVARADSRNCLAVETGTETVELTARAELQAEQCGAPPDYRIRVRVEAHAATEPTIERHYQLTLFNPLTQVNETLVDAQVAAGAPLPGFERLFNVNGWPSGQVRVEARIDGRPQLLGFDVLPSPGPPEPYFITPLAGQRVCSARFPAQIRDARYPQLRLVKAESGAGASPQSWLVVSASQDLITSWVTSLSLAGNPHGTTSLRVRAASPDGAVACAVRTVNVDARVDAFRRAPSERPLTGLTGNPLGLSVVGSPEYRQLQIPLTALESVQWESQLAPAEAVAPLVPSGPGLGAVISPQTAEGDFNLRWDGRLGGAPVSDGRYVLITKATDSSCGQTLQFKDALLVDNTPPTVVVAQPTEGAVIDGAVLQVIGSVTDLQPGSTKVELAAAATPDQWQSLPAGNAAGVLASFNRGNATGAYQLRVTATDLLGNRSVVLRNITLGAPMQLIGGVSTQPGLFSPNGDGVLDQTRIEIDLRRAVKLDVSVQRNGQSLRLLAQDQALPNGLHALVWDGRDSAGVVVPDGDLQVLVRAVDAADAAQVEQQTLQITLDTAAPTFTDVLPAGADLGCDQVVSFRVADAHLDSYQAQLRNAAGALLRSVEGSQVGVVAFGDLSSWQDQTGLRLDLRATDQAGNKTEVSQPLLLDCQAPVAHIDLPTDQSVIARRTGSSVAITGTATDAALARYWIEWAPADPLAPWQVLHEGTSAVAAGTLFGWSPAQPDGPIRLRLRVRDRAGNESMDQRELIVDGTAPVAELTAPADNASVTSALRAEGTASDVNLAAYQLQLARVGSEAWETVLEQERGVVSGLLGELAIPGEGDFRLRLRVTDHAGFETLTAPRRLRIDNLPPASPTALTAVVEQNRHVRLSWPAVLADDLAGYRLERDGTPITAGLIAARSHLDQDVAEGTHVYRVYAVDQAGNSSSSSPPASATIDHTPPQALLLAPQQGERIRGNYAVLGTISADDLREYRVSWTPLQPAGAGVELRRSGQAVQAGELARLDTAALAPDAQGRLRLTAEDLVGNIATVERDIVVDNQPPAAPQGLSLQQVGADLQVSWTVNAESDLLGYVLYRNGVPVNAGGALPADLRALALPNPLYLDPQVPDGHLEYRVYAIDQAGNLSPPSVPAAIDIESGPPHLEIVAPDYGFAFETSLEIIARSDDEDIAAVDFSWRVADSGSWTALAQLQSPPWQARWTPATGVALGDYELRAVARDTGGRIDPFPPAVRVRYADLTAPPAPTAVVASADGRSVRVQWLAVAANDLAGYEVRRLADNGGMQVLTSTPISALEFMDSDVPDGRWTYVVIAIDTAQNRSAEARDEARVFGLRATSPATPTLAAAVEIDGQSDVPGELQVVRTPTFETPPATARTDENGNFLLSTVPLALGNNLLQLRVLGADGDLSIASTLQLDRATRPAAPTALVAAVNGTTVSLSWIAPPEPNLIGYQLRDRGELLPPAAPLAQTVTATGSCCNPELTLDGDAETYWYRYPDVSGGVMTAELLYQWDQPALIDRLELDWTRADARATAVQLDAWSGHGWVPLLGPLELDDADQHVLRLAQPYRTTALRLRPLRAASYIVALSEVRIREFPLIPATSYSYEANEGQHQYTVSAWNWYGYESDPSAPPTVAGVGDDQAPPPVTLSGTVAGADAQLDWTASSAPDVASYLLDRDGHTIAVLPAAAPREYLDAGLANGRYRYAVRAVDAVGNIGLASNDISLDVAGDTPAAPRLDSLVPVPAGNALALAWTPAAAGAAAVRFEIERAPADSGPFALVHSTTDTAWTQTGLVNGQRYAYRVFAMDARGNRSAASNVLSAVVGDSTAPLPPVLSLPTLASEPIQWDVPRLPVCGVATPGSLVQIARNDQNQGGLLTALPADQRTLVAMDGNRVQQVRLSPQGDLYYARLSRPSSIVEAELRRFDGSAAVLVSPIPEQPRFSARGDELFGVHPFGGQLLRYALATGTSSVLASELDQVRGYAVSSDGQHWVIAGARSSETGLWRYDRNTQSLARLPGIALEDLRADQLALSPDGSQLLLAREDGQLILRDLASGQSTVLTTALDLSAPPAQLAPDDRSVSWIEADASAGTWLLKVHAFATGQTGTLHTLPAKPRVMRYGPDGSELLVLDQTLLRLLLADGSERPAVDLGAPNYYLQDVHVAASGRLLVQPDASLTSSYFARIDLAGSFCLRDVPTVAGSNRFTATAADAQGNVSAASAPAIVLVPASGTPDLAVSSADLRFTPSAALSGDVVRAFVSLRNSGSAPAANPTARIQWLSPDGVLRTFTPVLPTSLAAGASTTVTLDLGQLSRVGAWRLNVELDPANALFESNEANNVASATLTVSADATPLLELALDSSSVLPGATLRGRARVLSPVTAFEGTVVIEVRDSTGVVVSTLAEAGTGPLAAAVPWTGPFQWTPDVFAGTYQVHARLLSLAGSTLAERSAEVQVQAVRNVQLGLRTDRQSYAEGDTVAVNPSLVFSSGNALLTNASLRLSAQSSAGAPVWNFERPLGTLTPGARLDQTVPWPLGSTPAGSYTLNLRLSADGYSQQISHSILVTPAQAVSGVLGSIRSLPGSSVAVGAASQLEWNLRNTSAAPLAGVAARVRLLTVPALAEVLSESTTLSLAGQESVIRTVLVTPATLALGDHLAVLEARLPGDAPDSWRRLAQASVIAIDGTPPQIVLERPVANSFAPRPTALRGRITDSLSGVDHAELRLDGAAWTAIGLVEDGRYGRIEGALAEGPHQFQMRATDRQGNQTTSAILSFTVDATAPLIVISGVVDGTETRDPVVPVVQFSDDHLASTSLRLNGQEFVSGSSVSAEGSYYVSASATDQAGNRSDRAVSFRIDRTAPTVLFAGPDPQIEVTTDTVTVSLTTESGATVQLATGAWTASQTTASGLLQFESVPLLPGSNTLSAFATDRAGNAGPAATLILVRSEEGGDWLGDLTPAAPEIAAGTSLQLSARIENASDQPREGSFRVRVLPPGGGAAVATLPFNHSFGAGAVHIEALAVTTNGFALGSHALVLELLPASGPAQELATAAVEVVDRQPPQLAMLSPPALVAAQLSIEVQASDALSSIASVQARLDGGDWFALALVAGSTDRYSTAAPLDVSEGVHLIEAQAIDLYGNVASTSRGLSSDQSAPLIAISGVSDGQLAHTALTPVFTVSDAHPGSSSATLNGQPFSSGSTLQTDGAYSLLVQAQDQVGNAAQRSLSFRIDRTPPQVTITQPADASIVLSQQIPVSGSTEPDASLTLVCGSYQTSMVANGAGAFSFPAVPLVAGQNVIDVRATDAAGNTGPVRSVRVDYRLNAGVAFSGTLTTPVSSPQGQLLPVEFNLRNTSKLPAQNLPVRLEARRLGNATLLDRHELQVSLAAGASQTGNHSFTTKGWPIADIELRLEAQYTADDGSAVWTPLAVAVVTLRDGRAPTVDWLAPADGSWHGASVRVSARASDADSGIASVQAQLGKGVPVILQPLGGDLFEAQLPTGGDGLFTLKLSATDGAGNSAGAPPRSVQIDRQPPQLTILDVVDGQVGRDPVTPRIEVSDANPTTLVATLDGKPYTPGTAIASEGAHLLLAQASDLAGNTGAAQVRFSIDRTPPPLTVIHPVEGAVLLSSQLQVIGSSEAGARISASANGSSVEAVADSKGQFTLALNLLRGPNTLLLSARDALDNSSAPLTLHVTVLVDPVVSVSGTLDLKQSEHAHGTPLDFNASVRNLGDALTALPLRVRVETVTAPIQTIAQWDALVDLPLGGQVVRPQHFDTTSWPLGMLWIRLDADLHAAGTRGARRSELASRQIVLVDRSAPQLAILMPLAGQSMAPGQRIEASASDALSGISRVEARVDGAGDWLPLDPLDAGLQRYGRVLDLPAGPHQLAMRAVDGAGNLANAGPIAFSVQRSLPLSLSQPANGSRTGVAQLDFIGLTEAGARVELLRASGHRREAVADGKGRFVFPTVALDFGVNSFTLQASAADGSRSPPLQWSVERRGLAEIPVDALQPAGRLLLLLLFAMVALSSLALRRTGGAA